MSDRKLKILEEKLEILLSFLEKKEIIPKPVIFDPGLSDSGNYNLHLGGDKWLCLSSPITEELRTKYISTLFPVARLQEEGLINNNPVQTL